MMLIDLVVGWWKGELRRMTYPGIQLGAVVTVPQVVEALAPYHSGARLDSQDGNYQTMELIDRKDYLKWLHNLDVGEYSPQFDCDDFALNYWLWCRLIYSRKDRRAAAPVIGYCKAPGHAINFALTPMGVRFFDPQKGIVEAPNNIYWLQF